MEACIYIQYHLFYALFPASHCWGYQAIIARAHTAVGHRMPEKAQFVVELGTASVNRAIDEGLTTGNGRAVRTASLLDHNGERVDESLREQHACAVCDAQESRCSEMPGSP
jgi:hypothetical protein